MRDVNSPSNRNCSVSVALNAVILRADSSATGVACEPVKIGCATVTVLEQRDSIGGNAGSLEIDGVDCDYDRQEFESHVVED
jgi:hypothetical protein